MFDNIVVGNTLAALVATHELGKQGRSTLLIKHRGGWGGHFSGLDVNGTHFDAGMTIVELTSNNWESAPDLSSYNTLVRNDVGRYFGVVKEYIEGVFPLHEMSLPQSYFRGNWHQDFLLCNNFEIFESFSADERKAISAELGGIDAQAWPHASNKIKLQELHTVASYQQTSKYNHGELIHGAIIEPYVSKLSGGSSADVASIFHRRLWAPLYYPATLRQAALGELSKFGDTVIHYPHGGTFQSFATNLLGKIEMLDSVTILDSAVTNIDALNSKLSVEGQSQPYEYSNLAWTSSLAECQRLLGLEPIEDTQSKRASLAFDFMLVDAQKLNKDFTVVFIFDKDVPCYRITNQTACSGVDEPFARLIVEFNTDYISQYNINNKDEIHSAAVQSLVEMGIILDASAIHQSTVKLLPNLLPIPALSYEETVKKNIEVVNLANKNITLFGESSGIATRSFADNFVQGLKYAEHGSV